MRISTRLVFTIMAPALMGLIIIALLAVSYQSTQASQQNGTRVREIRDSLTNLDGYVYSYLLFPGDRPQQQFTTEYKVLTQLIAGVHLQDPDQQELLENIRLNSIAMNDMFLQLQAQYVGSNLAAEARLQGSLLIKSRDADVNASLLKKSLDDQINSTQITSIALIFIVVLLLSIPFTVILIRMRKHITSSLNKLRIGTEAVGGGNLDYRMNLAVGDELGDLARSFDSMTGQLQAITVSRVRLQQEVEERIKAEEELKRYTLELESANKELEAFSYSVSHDLRQPLRALDGFSLAVVDNLGDKLDETNKDYLDRVRKASQTMGRLIDDLLKLSRITRAEMSYNFVNLSELAGTIAEELRNTQPDARQTSLSLRT
jgi:signal transduction histidine kinase